MPRVVYYYDITFEKLIKLTARRYLLAGYFQIESDTTNTRIEGRRPVQMRLDALTGDTLTRVLSALDSIGQGFDHVEAMGDGTFYGGMGISTGPRPPYPAFSGNTIFVADTLGRRLRQWYIPAGPGYAPSNGSVNYYPWTRRVVRLPSGWLQLQGEDDISVVAVSGLLRFDDRGRVRYRTRLPDPTPNGLYHLEPRPDGAYVAAGFTTRYGPYRYTARGFNPWLVQFRANGDTICSGKVISRLPSGSTGVRLVRTTPDGGSLVVGQQRQRVFGPPNTQPCLFKFDSLGRHEWTTTLIDTSDWFGGGKVLDVQPLAQGGYVALFHGSRVWSAGAPVDTGQTRTTKFVGLDSAGRVRWVVPYSTTPGIRFGAISWIYEPDGSVVLFGGGGPPPPGYTGGYYAVTKFTGLPLPWVPNYCARPPAVPVAGYQMQSGGTFAFTADSTTSAGPRYAELDQCTWDFGDGTPPQTGWSVRHTYATPDPVRVRVCVTNNMFCQTCRELFPLGPVQGVADEAPDVVAQLWPNPSADGHFVLRTSAPRGAGLAVYDALGRAVLTTRVTEAEQGVDLRAQPAGVYALRLTLPDGRRLTRRLVRW